MSTFPTELVAGDTFTATHDHADYPASSGWAATLYLIGASAVPTSQAGAASGSAFTFTIASATTANLAAGIYAARIVYTKSGERRTYEAGSVTVRADPTANATRLRDTKGTWGKIVLDLEAAYQDYIAAGRVGVESYTINGRQMKYTGSAAILAALQNARIEERRERQAAGESFSSGSFVTRM